MTAETDLLPLPSEFGHPSLQALGVVSQNYARACVSSATEALRGEVERLEIAGRLHSGVADLAINAARAAEARAERLAEALRSIAASAEEATTGEGHAECASIARAALEQETTNG